MNVTMNSSEGLKRNFTVTVPAADIQAKIIARLQELMKNIKMAGFRPGKAPLDMVKKRYGASVVPEVLEDVANETAFKALEQNNIRPALRPKIQPEKFKDGEDFVYKMDVEILPEISVKGFDAIALERFTAKPADNDIQAAVDNLAKATRSTEKAEAGHAAQKGDIVVIDFDGSVDGIKRDGMKGDDHSLELGSNQFIPGFEEQLIGAKEGDHKTVSVSFPEGYHAADLSGKAAVFEVDVKEIRTPSLPNVDDAWAKNFGAESLDNLKEKVTERLQSEYDRATQFKLKRALLDQLADQYDFEVPPSMMDSEFRQIWSQVQEEIKRYGKSEEDAGKSDAELETEYRKIAERRVRLGLLLAEIGRSNNVSVNDNELSQALQQEVMRYPGRGKEVVEFYQKNPGAVDMLRAPIFEQKVVDHILSQIKISEQTISSEELMKDAMDQDDMPMTAHADHDHAPAHGEQGHVHGPDCNH